MESSLKTRVVFSAVRSSSSESGDYYNHVKPGEVITFTHTEANIGNGMNPDTGFFTVPVSGIYSFSFSAMSNGIDTSTYIQVCQNGVKQFTISDPNSYGLLGYSWTMYLAQNDIIHLYNVNNGLYVTPDINVWFNGQLLMAE